MKLYEYEGQSRTLKEWAKIYGLTECAARHRLYNGTSLSRRFGDEFEHLGRRMSLQQWAEAKGMSYRAVQQRLINGVPLRRCRYCGAATCRCEGQLLEFKASLDFLESHSCLLMLSQHAEMAGLGCSAQRTNKGWRVSLGRRSAEAASLADACLEVVS